MIKVNPYRRANYATSPGRSPSDGKGIGWSVWICTSGVLDTTEVPLHPDTHGVVCVGQLEALSVVVVEREHLARHTRKVL